MHQNILSPSSSSANRAKLLHLERDHRDLQRTYELYKQRTERAAAEIEKNNKKLNTQLHTERKEVVKLKEVIIVIIICCYFNNLLFIGTQTRERCRLDFN